MTKSLAQFYDLVMPELPGITTNMVDAHLVLLARELCETASLWRADFDPSATVALQADYDVDPSEQAETVRLTRLTVNGTLLWDQHWSEDTSGCAPRYDSSNPPFTLSDDLLTLTLIAPEIPDCSVSDGFQVSGAMKPKVGAKQLPDILLSMHAEAMRYGTLARLMRMGKKPWTDQQLSADYERRFKERLAFAASAAQGGNTRAPLRTRVWGQLGPRTRASFL